MNKKTKRKEKECERYIKQKNIESNNQPTYMNKLESNELLVRSNNMSLYISAYI